MAIKTHVLTIKDGDDRISISDYGHSNVNTHGANASLGKNGDHASDWSNLYPGAYIEIYDSAGRSQGSARFHEAIVSTGAIVVTAVYISASEHLLAWLNSIPGSFSGSYAYEEALEVNSTNYSDGITIHSAQKQNGQYVSLDYAVFQKTTTNESGEIYMGKASKGETTVVPPSDSTFNVAVSAGDEIGPDILVIFDDNK